MDSLINLIYLAAAVLFIFGIKGMTHPRTARRGNLMSAVGMLLAIVVTLLDKQIVSFEYIVAGLVIGSAIGALLALKIQMTAMPQMVALFNGFGGGGSLLVAGLEFMRAVKGGSAGEAAVGLQMSVATVLAGFIGTITLIGSLVAFGKLQGLISDKWGSLPGIGPANIVLGLGVLGLGAAQVLHTDTVLYYWLLVAVSVLMGVTLVIKIGGADMPVAISLLNSYSGLAAAAAGFVITNNVLIISGALVGASGLILTNIMCKAMNRSLMNVLTGGLSGAGAKAPTADEVYGGKIKSVTAEEIAMMLDGIQRFVVVPGYGMAVAQAQHAVRDLANLLEQRGVEVEYAIHPVAGRMPGHMNVLLAEADVPYEKLKTMEEINPTMPQVDIAFVIGANDVVNPDARKPDSPIAGMPIIDVDLARTVIVNKRSLSPGYAGIPNPLFARDNCLMYFADGKKAVLDIINALKELD
ncbi:MAG: NAD(P)(+) transhydrogenase (Re/Si-specific) subunit beta [Candidatus Sumerlaeia bacterium]